MAGDRPAMQEIVPRCLRHWSPSVRPYLIYSDLLRSSQLSPDRSRSLRSEIGICVCLSLCVYVCVLSVSAAPQCRTLCGLRGGACPRSAPLTNRACASFIRRSARKTRALILIFVFVLVLVPVLVLHDSLELQSHTHLYSYLHPHLYSYLHLHSYS